MSERINRCSEVGCSAVCCRGVWMMNEYDQVLVKEIFPEVKEVPYYDFFDKNLPPGVYMQKLSFSGKYKIRIVGDCPRLEENNCALWNQKRLSDCEGVIFDSEECQLLKLGY